LKRENFYEGLFILNSESYSRNSGEVSGAIAETIEAVGGNVRVSRLWEERRLAYPIKNHRRGVYWLTYFRLATDQMEELNRRFRLNNDVIRFLLTKIDDRLEEALVSHALEGPKKPEDAEPESGKSQKDDDSKKDKKTEDNKEEKQEDAEDGTK
jgi:small subunit ribosomal protein S6